MVSMHVIFWLFLFYFSFLHFGGAFNETIIPLALVGYERIIVQSYPMRARRIIVIIIHQTHYEKSDWSRAFNQFTIACQVQRLPGY